MGVVKDMFKTPQITPSAAPATPARSDADVQRAAAEQRKKFQTEGPGRSATFFGGLGATAPRTGSAALLGMTG
jgi:hypothetical protein